MGPTTSHDLRCPKCGAHAPAAADWCTLCYADLRPPAEPDPTGVPPQQEAADADATLETSVGAAAEGARGKHARRPTAGETGTATAAPDGSLPAGVDLDLMIAQLAAETSAPLGSFMDRFDSKGSRALVLCGGVAAVVVLLLLVMTVLGSLL